MPLIEYPSNLGNPFTLGVASGDPLPDGVVLWTRLAPDPLHGGGMDGQQGVGVDWEVTTDADFTNVVQTSRQHPTAAVRPRAIAEASLAHSVHLEVTGLEPGTRYYYRFVVGNYESRGRTKTAPEPTADVPAMAFAFVNCQLWWWGLYPTYRHIAQDEELDFVVHLGDYIYEAGPPDEPGVRTYQTPRPTDLTGFRNRHAEYKTDEDLQAAHTAHPWVVTWDDHEVENDYAGTHSWHLPRSDFLQRRDAAYQAYFEHMPLRPSWVLGGQQWRNLNLYRRFAYGRLVQFLVLDTRQYRTQQPCGDRIVACNVERFKDLIDENGGSHRHTILGPEGTQEDWLKEALTSDGPLWNVIANQVPMFEYNLLYSEDPSENSSEGYYLDGWDGYVATRNRISEHLVENKVPNPIVITGDIHSAWVADLKYNPRDPDNSFKQPDSITFGTELVGTSISSGLSQWWIDNYSKALRANPHVKYFDGSNGGYVRCDLNSERFHADFLLTDSVSDHLSPVRIVASFEVYPESDPAKRTGAKQVYGKVLVNPPRWIGIGADGLLRVDGSYERGWYNTDNATGELYPQWFNYEAAHINPPRWIGLGANGVLRVDGPYERGWYNTDNATGELYPQWFNYEAAHVNPPRWIGLGADGLLRVDGSYELGWYDTDNATGELYPQWHWP